MRNHWTAAVASFILFAGPSPVLAEETVEAAIRARMEQYVAAWNRGAAEDAAAVYMEDGTHTYVFGYTHRGRTEIAKGLEELLGGPMKGSQLAIETLDIRQLSPDVAVEEEAFTISGLEAPDGTDLPAAKGLCLAVYKMVDGEWLGAAVQCMMPPPAPP
ncbi:MAG TPA: SgcJ/EcaC family oxidoreductase [Thermoanaerobaculia bacterium]|nr:SgcJ/EcaC family oxidoreductase [Thermoanaerobaculia bacterium]